MAKVVGFLKCQNIESSRKWFQDNLGVSSEWGAMFSFKHDPTGRKSPTAWIMDPVLAYRLVITPAKGAVTFV